MGNVGFNTAPKKEDIAERKHSSSTDGHGSTWLTAGGTNRNSTGSFSSCMTSSFLDRSKRSGEKSSPETLVDHALHMLGKHNDLFSEAKPHSDHPSVWRKLVSNIEVGKSPAPKDGAPVIPRRSSDPYLPLRKEFQIFKSELQADGLADDFGATSFFKKAPPSPQAAAERVEKEQRQNNFLFEGLVLEISELSEDGMKSDLTKTDQEDSSLEDQPENPENLGMEMSSIGSRKNPSRRRRRRKQAKKDLTETVGSGLIELPRHSVSPKKAAEVEVSDSPTTAQLSIGTGGTVRKGRGRGRSPRDFRSMGSRGERRWSPRSGAGEVSVDEILKTPKRKTRGDGKVDPFRHSNHRSAMRAANLQNRRSVSDGASPQYQTPIAERKNSSVPQAGAFFPSPPEDSVLKGFDGDNRAPSTSRPTPTPEGGSQHLREKIQTLKFPPPL